MIQRSQNSQIPRKKVSCRMNKILLGCLAVAAVVTINVQWTEANLIDDFVFFPSLKVKRDMEMEEFLKDGKTHEARVRAANRQRRSNEEADPEFYARHRRSLLEDDDDEGDFTCGAEESENMKRSIDRTKRNTRPDKIKYRFDDSQWPCSTESKSRIKSAMVDQYNKFTCCQFDLSEVAEPGTEHIRITCEGGSNYAPIGVTENSRERRVNIAEVNGKVPLPVAAHELGHVCGLRHEQQSCTASSGIDVQWDCISIAFQNQYKAEECDQTKDNVAFCPMSMMEYRVTAFLDKTKTAPDGQPCTKTMKSIYPQALNPDVFASFKTLYFSDVKKILETCNEDSPGTDWLYSDESILMLDGSFKISMYHPVSDPEVVQLEKGAGKNVEVLAGKVKLIRCKGVNLNVRQSSVSGVLTSPRCRKGAARIVHTSPDHLFYLEFACGDHVVEYMGKDISPSDYVYLDGTKMTSGQLIVDLDCA